MKELEAYLSKISPEATKARHDNDLSRAKSNILDVLRHPDFVKKVHEIKLDVAYVIAANGKTTVSQIPLYPNVAILACLFALTENLDQLITTMDMEFVRPLITAIIGKPNEKTSNPDN